MAQAFEIFGDNFHGMMANSEVKNFVGVQDGFTAEYMSKNLGTHSSGLQLVSAEELQRLRKGAQITFVRDQRPVVIENRPYYQTLWMRRATNKNPYHKRTPLLNPMYPLWVVKGWIVTVLAMARPTKRQVIIGGVLVGAYFGGRAWAGF